MFLSATPTLTLTPTPVWAFHWLQFLLEFQCGAALGCRNSLFSCRGAPLPPLLLMFPLWFLLLIHPILCLDRILCSTSNVFRDTP